MWIFLCGRFGLAPEIPTRRCRSFAASQSELSTAVSLGSFDGHSLSSRTGCAERRHECVPIEDENTRPAAAHNREVRLRRRGGETGPTGGLVPLRGSLPLFLREQLRAPAD